MRVLDRPLPERVSGLRLQSVGMSGYGTFDSFQRYSSQSDGCLET